MQWVTPNLVWDVTRGPALFHVTTVTSHCLTWQLVKRHNEKLSLIPNIIALQPINSLHQKSQYNLPDWSGTLFYVLQPADWVRVFCGVRDAYLVPRVTSSIFYESNWSYDGSIYCRERVCKTELENKFCAKWLMLHLPQSFPLLAMDLYVLDFWPADPSPRWPLHCLFNSNPAVTYNKLWAGELE